MNARLTAIRHRREELVARAGDQRQALGDLVEPWRTGLTLTDRAIALAREVRSHWITLAAGALLLSRMGRGRGGVWVRRLWTIWELYRVLRNPEPRHRP
jgi:hypothetical protein